MKAIAAAGLFLFSSPISALPKDVPVVPMKGIEGKNIDMPLVGIGVWEYNDTVAASAVEIAFNMGYRHVDTALIYQNQVGVGSALKKLALPRSEYFVTSKIPGGLNASATEAALDQCLQQLGLDYVDLMLLHFPAETGGAAGRQEEWRALEAWAKKGKAKAIGVSHYCRRQLEDILSIATVPVAVNQVQYHVGMGQSGGNANDDMDFVRQKGILYESFSPLCGPCNPPDNTELITGELVTSIGKAHNKTGPQVALKWLVQQGIPVIPKSSKAKHIQENMDLFGWTLTDDEMNRLTMAESPAVGGGPSPTDSGDCSIEDAFVV
jgi:diketogulonate reductase-like aldo/keto reductase